MWSTTHFLCVYICRTAACVSRRHLYKELKWIFAAAHTRTQTQTPNTWKLSCGSTKMWTSDWIVSESLEIRFHLELDLQQIIFGYDFFDFHVADVPFVLAVAINYNSFGCVHKLSYAVAIGNGTIIEISTAQKNENEAQTRTYALVCYTRTHTNDQWKMGAMCLDERNQSLSAKKRVSTKISISKMKSQRLLVFFFVFLNATIALQQQITRQCFRFDVVEQTFESKFTSDDDKYWNLNDTLFKQVQPFGMARVRKILIDLKCEYSSMEMESLHSGFDLFVALQLSAPSVDNTSRSQCHLLSNWDPFSNRVFRWNYLNNSLDSLRDMSWGQLSVSSALLQSLNNCGSCLQSREQMVRNVMFKIMWFLYLLGVNNRQ